MTDRVRSLTVVLDRDFRTDDVETVAQAIRMVKGVQSVEDGPVVDMDAHLQREAFRSEVLRSIIDFSILATRGGDKWAEVKRILDATRDR